MDVVCVKDSTQVSAWSQKIQEKWLGHDNNLYLGYVNFHLSVGYFSGDGHHVIEFIILTEKLCARLRDLVGISIDHRNNFY